MLQKARETVIAYQRLNSEVQKKEILLSCISEEMNTALANVITALRLIELEKNPARLSHLLSLASRGTEEQQALINKVLNLFAPELEGLYGRNGATPAEAKLDDVLSIVKENVVSQFAEKRVRLSFPERVAPELRAAMDAGHLVRVLSNFLENGLQNSSAAGEVRLNLVAEPESLLIQVLDDGAPLPGNDDFFSKGVAAATKPQAAHLPLQFCRIAVESCHGEIGYEPRAEGGNCFWIRLPKPASAQ
jgi:K+-sensing histidine kinase KdpD